MVPRLKNQPKYRYDCQLHAVFGGLHAQPLFHSESLFGVSRLRISPFCSDSSKKAPWQPPMSKSASDTDEFYVEVHRRMVESGEWDRILRLLTSKLSEHGWVDEIRHRAKERARSMDALSFRLLLEEIMPPAQASIPPTVKREVTNILRQYVKDQFEK